MFFCVRSDVDADSCCAFSPFASWFSFCLARCSPTHPTPWAWKESCEYTCTHTMCTTRAYTHTHTQWTNQQKWDKQGHSGAEGRAGSADKLNNLTQQALWMETSAESVRYTHTCAHIFAHSEGREECMTLLQPVCVKCWFSFVAESEQGRREKEKAKWNTKVPKKSLFLGQESFCHMLQSMAFFSSQDLDVATLLSALIHRLTLNMSPWWANHVGKYVYWKH